MGGEVKKGVSGRIVCQRVLIIAGLGPEQPVGDDVPHTGTKTGGQTPVQITQRLLDAFRELLLPQTTVLVGNHSTLWRWLLPDWSADKPPSARDIARAANTMGVPYTLVTGVVLPGQLIENTLA